MRLFQHNTIRLTMCALAFVNSPGQEGWGFPLWPSKHRQCSSTDGQQGFLPESGSPMARAWVRTAIEGFIVTQECTAPAALAGLVLRFSGHSFPLEDSPCTRAPPQTASVVVITLLSVLLIVRLNLEGGLFREFRTRSRAVLPPLLRLEGGGEDGGACLCWLECSRAPPFARVHSPPPTCPSSEDWPSHLRPVNLWLSWVINQRWSPEKNLLLKCFWKFNSLYASMWFNVKMRAGDEKEHRVRSRRAFWLSRRKVQ